MNRRFEELDMLKWMTKVKTTLVQKDPSRGHYRPITCLPAMWEIISSQIRKEIYYS